MAEIKRIEIDPYSEPWFELTCKRCDRVFYIFKLLRLVNEEDAICEDCLNESKNIDDIMLDWREPATRRYDLPTREKLDRERKEREEKLNEDGSNIKYYNSKRSAPDEDDIMRDLENGDGEYHGY